MPLRLFFLIAVIVVAPFDARGNVMLLVLSLPIRVFFPKVMNFHDPRLCKAASASWYFDCMTDDDWDGWFSLASSTAKSRTSTPSFSPAAPFLSSRV
jgi:hypothetical protein